MHHQQVPDCTIKVVGTIHVGTPFLQQEVHRRILAKTNTIEKGSITVPPVRDFNRRTKFLDKAAHHSQVAPLSCDDQRRVSTRAYLVDVCAEFRHEDSHDFEKAATSSNE